MCVWGGGGGGGGVGCVCIIVPDSRNVALVTDVCAENAQEQYLHPARAQLTYRQIGHVPWAPRLGGGGALSSDV